MLNKYLNEICEVQTDIIQATLSYFSAGVIMTVQIYCWQYKNKYRALLKLTEVFNSNTLEAVSTCDSLPLWNALYFIQWLPPHSSPSF